MTANKLLTNFLNNAIISISYAYKISIHLQQKKVLTFFILYKFKNLDFTGFVCQKTANKLLTKLPFFSSFLSILHILLFCPKNSAIPVNIELQTLAEVAELVDAQDSGS